MKSKRCAAVPIDRSEMLALPTGTAIAQVTRYSQIHGHCPLLRGKCSIAAVSGADGVAGHDPEMIRGARTQARDVRDDILVIVPSLGLVGRSGSVAGGSSILKVHRGAQSVGINCAVESG